MYVIYVSHVKICQNNPPPSILDKNSPIRIGLKYGLQFFFIARETLKPCEKHISGSPEPKLDAFSATLVFKRYFIKDSRVNCRFNLRFEIELQNLLKISD